jgi:hypothetical protein
VPVSEAALPEGGWSVGASLATGLQSVPPSSSFRIDSPGEYDVQIGPRLLQVGMAEHFLRVAR